MADTTKEQLEENCRSIAEELEKFTDSDYYYSEKESGFRKKGKKYDPDDDMGAYGYIENSVYDVKMVVDLRGNMYSCRLMVAGGGPNIYIDTGDMEVQGYWGADECHVPISREVCALLNDEVEFLRGC